MNNNHLFIRSHLASRFSDANIIIPPYIVGDRIVSLLPPTVYHLVPVSIDCEYDLREVKTNDAERLMEKTK